jgi:hypothetical protein
MKNQLMDEYIILNSNHISAGGQGNTLLIRLSRHQRHL